jgi:hypothetical protein
MDDEVRKAIAGNLADAAPEYPQCPDCGKPFTPKHMCRESMLQRVAQEKAAFEIAIKGIYNIRNALIMWRRGKETEKLYEISRIAKQSIVLIDELLGLQRKKADESNSVGDGEPGGISDSPFVGE